MHILELSNYEITLTEEALLIKPIRDLFNKDKSKNKEKFMQQAAVLYYMIDPRSSYNYIMDEKERLNAIIEEQGLPEDFEITPLMEKAMKAYQQHTITTSYLLLQDTKTTVENIRKVLKSIDFDNLEEKDKVNALKTATSTISMMPKLIKDLSEVENTISKEIEEVGRARGGQQKTLMDDGILL